MISSDDEVRRDYKQNEKNKNEIFENLKTLDLSENVRYLDLSDSQISDISFVSRLTKLETLILDNNKISDKDVSNFGNEKSFINHGLRILSLNKNRLTDIQVFKDVFGDVFQSVEMLSLHGNSLCPDGLSDKDLSYDYEEYKVSMMDSFPKLKFLDHAPVSRTYKGSDIRRHTEIIRFHPLMILEKLRFRKTSDYQPLSDNSCILGEHSGKFSYKNYKYVDKNSEGNRFIVNSDL
ncbi:hypothetical protein ACFFRR_002688 [Megaselia abdita]